MMDWWYTIRSEVNDLIKGEPCRSLLWGKLDRRSSLVNAGAAEGALKTAQIYTDLINDWIQIGYYSIVLKSVSMLLKCNYEEVFIRLFYLDRNSFGYYRGYFIDPVTGIRDSGKSTHTKYKIEATMIATSWLQNVATDCVFTSNR